MYVCHHCGAKFHEPGLHRETETHHELDGSPVECLYFWYCPECGWDDMDDYVEEEEEEE